MKHQTGDHTQIDWFMRNLFCVSLTKENELKPVKYLKQIIVSNIQYLIYDFCIFSASKKEGKQLAPSIWISIIDRQKLNE